NYTDEAQHRCLNAFIEHQQEQIAQLEGRVQAQQDLVGQLKGQIDRQAAATSQPPVATAIVPPPYVYPYTYTYPPVGIGLYLGRPWGVPGYYGYYGRPYWGPRFFYRHYGRRWEQFTAKVSLRARAPSLVAVPREITTRLPIG